MPRNRLVVPVVPPNEFVSLCQFTGHNLQHQRVASIAFILSLKAFLSRYRFVLFFIHTLHLLDGLPLLTLLQSVVSGVYRCPFGQMGLFCLAATAFRMSLTPRPFLIMSRMLSF